jgi:release factor glutamine methyltransferase
VSVSDGYDIISSQTGVPYKQVISRLSELTVDSYVFGKVYSELEQGVPIAYITGRKEFFGLEFNVSRDTLIPRSETEILVELAVKEKPATVLDLATGSGAVLLSILSELPDSMGVGVDISAKAIEIAKSNASKLKIIDRAAFECYDILNGIRLGKGYELITCNPPYLNENEYGYGSLRYEPMQALVAPDNGFKFYDYIINFAARNNVYVPILMEIGAYQGDRVSKLAKRAGFEVDIYKDLAGRDRVVKLCLN